jgi:3',5'-cyclic-AMP phosphodiesterase
MLRLIQISDLHLRREPHTPLRGVDVDAGLAAVLAHARRHHWPADAVLATGDLVHEDASAYPRLQALLEPLGVPVHCLPGNHDVAEFATALAAGTVRRERRVLMGDWQIVLLDSTIPGKDGGHLESSELTFLDRMLGEHADRPALVFLHHHPVPTGTDWLDGTAVDNPDQLFAVLDRHPQVRALIWGHIHQVYQGRRNGVELLSAPATCAQFMADPPPPNIEVRQAPGYRWLHLHPDGRLDSGVEWVEP